MKKRTETQDNKTRRKKNQKKTVEKIQGIGAGKRGAFPKAASSSYFIHVRRFEGGVDGCHSLYAVRGALLRAGRVPANPCASRPLLQLKKTRRRALDTDEVPRKHSTNATPPLRRKRCNAA